MGKGQSMGVEQWQSSRQLSLALSEKELCPENLLAGQEAAYAKDIRRLQRQKKKFVSVPCPACNSETANPVFIKYGFRFLCCVCCGTIYMSPRPTAALMASYYANSENYKYWAKHIFPQSEAIRQEKLHAPRLQRIVEYCQRFGIPMGTLLEMGPGFGTFAALAQQSGFFHKVMAVEPTPELAEICRQRGLETWSCRIEDLPPLDKNVQCIVAFEVIEHLFSVRPVLEALWGQLDAGGLLVLTCPNGCGFDIAMLGAKALAVDSEHVNFFNPHSLLLLVENCGFKVLDVSTPGQLDAEFVRQAALENKISLERQPFLKRVLLDEWERLGKDFQKFLEEHILSSHMWLVARKTT